MDGDDAFTVSKDVNGKVTAIKFGYWHYETKHWGLPGMKSQNEREKMFGSSGIYSSLCPSEELNFNNNAAMMVLTADVVSADGKFAGTADFYIHEGFCCQPNSLAATTEAEAARDFSTFRNVLYTYKININGMESIDTKVSSRDLSDDFYHGVGGELYSPGETRSMTVPEGGASYDIELPNGQLYWYIESEEGSFGIPLPNDEDLQKWYGAAYKYTGAQPIDETNEFYQSIRINGLSLGEYSPSSTRAGDNKVKISFTGAPSVNGMLYLCGVQRSLDNLVTYYTVYQFDQSGQLATPELKMLNAPSGNLIMGIDDHTIYWKPVTGATSYTIELVAKGALGGYKINLPASGNAVSDASVIPDGTPINVNIDRETVSGEEYLKFRVRYANKSGGMLSFFRNGDNSSAVTIRVTAHKSNGESSEPGSITRTIINPVWDFSEAAYRDAVKAQTGVTTGAIGVQQAVTYNKLTMHTGEENRMVFQSYNGYYGYNPGGAGNKDKFHFSFHACSRGHVKAYTSSNNGNTNVGRFVQVDYDGNTNGLIQSADATAKAINNGYSEIKMDSFNPSNQSGTTDNVFVMNSGNIVFYKISFTPEDI